jgi:RHS repeat-associated protein
VLTKAVVAATLKYPGYDGSITVATFTGAAGPGAHATAASATGAPSVSLSTTGAGSLVWAAGEDPSHATPRTAASGQSVVYDGTDSAGSDTFWSQRTASPVSPAGTTVKIADTAPTADKWNLAAVEITAAVPGLTQATYKYNEDGDLTGIDPVTGPATGLTYDQANRLTGYGTNATYSYDGNGLRMSRTVGGTTTKFAWDQSGGVPLLIAAGSTYYVSGPDGQPIEQVDTTSSTPSYLLADQQGSIRLITSTSGAVTGTYSYGPYGAVTGHTGTATTALQYDGQYTDAESGLQYLQARYYDPSTGGFLSVDPLVAATGDPYEFGADNPLNAVDPTGLSWYNPLSWSKSTWEDVGTGAAVVAIVAGGTLICVASVVCAGTVAGWAGATTLGEGLALTETVGGVASTVFDGAVATEVTSNVAVGFHDCAGGMSPACEGDEVGLGLNALTLGAGETIPESVWQPTFNTGGEIGGQVYDKYLKSRLFPCQRSGGGQQGQPPYSGPSSWDSSPWM